MQLHFLSFRLAKTALVGIALSFLLLPKTSVAQFEPASPPIANPADTRFAGVKEDWTSPALTSSHLRAARPVVGYLNSYPTYTVELLQVQWRFGDPLDLYVMKPKGVKKPPVIIYLYSFPEDTDRFKEEEFQRRATKDGFAAVGFVSALTGQRYHDRPMREWFISELQESLAASAHDLQMVVNYLSSRNDLDMSRVGMYTAGSGASIAILASAVDSRIKVLDLLDPWGDWPKWMAGSPMVPAEERAEYVKPAFLGRVALLEPVDWLPKVQAKRFRLQERLYQPDTPRAAKEKLRAAASGKGTVVIYKTPKDMEKMLIAGKELEWIEHQLQSVTETDQVAAKGK